MIYKIKSMTVAPRFSMSNSQTTSKLQAKIMASDMNKSVFSQKKESTRHINYIFTFNTCMPKDAFSICRTLHMNFKN